MLSGKTDAQLGYFILRTALGLDLFGHGFVRLAGNYSTFHDGMVAEFAKSILPEFLVSLIAWAIPPVELVLGALLILGFRTREALLASGLLMFVLIFGSSMIQNWGAVGIQLSHTLVFSALLAFRSHNAICIDSNRAAHFHT